MSTLLIVLLLNLMAFIIAFIFKSDKFTDFMYGISFFAIAVFLYLKSNMTVVYTLLFIIISLWALRLASYLVIRIIKTKRDRRFDGIRESFWKFGFFWFFQAITAWVIMIPLIYFFSNLNNNFGWSMFFGVSVWILGFGLESISDLQKFKFNNNIKNKGRFISSGLWSLSRHPNYLGEILMWIGVYVYVFSALSLNAKIISLSSPILIITLLIFITGIPKLESYADKKWGDEKDYQKYKKNVPTLIPKIKLLK